MEYKIFPLMVEVLDNEGNVSKIIEESLTQIDYIEEKNFNEKSVIQAIKDMAGNSCVLEPNWKQEWAQSGEIRVSTTGYEEYDEINIDEDGEGEEQLIFYFKVEAIQIVKSFK